MKPYTLRIHDKETARALVSIFVDGIRGIESDRSPEEQEAIDLVTRLGEWSEGDE